MNRPPINAKRVLIAVTALLLICSQLPVGTATAVSYLPHALLDFATRPASLLHRASTTLRPGRDETTKYDKQYGWEKKYISELEQEIIELRNVSESLAQIDALLDIEEIRPAGASVVGFNGDLENPILTISIASEYGIREGLAVVWGASLVGKIVSTTGATAEVQLITAADTKLQVRIARYTPDGPSTPVPAYIQLAEDGRSFFTEEFSVNDPVAVGDLVHLADDSWQFRARGFIVGVVESAEPHPDRPYLNKYVVIRPMLSLTSLPRVVVLVPRD